MALMVTQSMSVAMKTTTKYGTPIPNNLMFGRLIFDSIRNDPTI